MDGHSLLCVHIFLLKSMTAFFSLKLLEFLSSLKASTNLCPLNQKYSLEYYVKKGLECKRFFEYFL